MRWLLFLLCFFGATQAQAIPCVNAKPGWTTFFDWQAWGYERKSLGRYAALYCLDENKALKPLLYVCPHEGGGCDVQAHFDLLIAIKNAPTPEASLDLGRAAASKATYNCYEVKDELTPRGAMCKEAIKWEEDNRARWTANYVPPAMEAWKVAYNSACSDANKAAGTCTRPVSVYNPVTKTRSVAKGETVAVGAPCYPAVVTHKDSPNSSITYMAIYSDRPDRVAVCAKG